MTGMNWLTLIIMLDLRKSIHMESKEEKNAEMSDVLCKLVEALTKVLDSKGNSHAFPK